jgi:hypothetical protein
MATLNIPLTNVQPTLVSGDNIKTINGTSILGSGDLVVGGGSGVDTVTGDGVSGTSADVVLTFPTPTEIGLGSVDNTSDANKPVSTAAQTALDLKVDKVGGKSLIDDTEISRLATMTAIFTTALKTAYDTASSWVVTNGTNVLNHLSNTANPHSVTASQVSLGNVDNTSDANKPVSTAAQTALDLKVDKVGGKSLIDDTEISRLATMTAIFTTALKTAYDTASSWIVTNGTNVLNHLSNTSNPHSVTATQLSLGNVDNTSDASKPISSATQTALDAKTAKLISFNRQTASYTLVLTDADKVVEQNVATANTLTIPPNSTVAFAIGTQIILTQYGAGQVTATAGVGVTLRSEGTKIKTIGQYSIATLIKVATDEWYIGGSLTA